MSLEAMSSVFKCECLTSTQKLISLYIADKVHQDHGYDFYSTKINCQRFTSLNEKTVIKVFKELLSLGYIIDSGKRKGKVLVYKFDIKMYKKGEKDVYTPKKGGTHTPNNGGIHTPNNGGTKQNTTQTKHLREDAHKKSPPKSSKKTIKSVKPLSMETLMERNLLNIPEAMIMEWREWRIHKGWPVNDTKWNNLEKELNLCIDNGISLIEAFEYILESGNQGFKAEWMLNRKTKPKVELDPNDTSWADNMGEF